MPRSEAPAQPVQYASSSCLPVVDTQKSLVDLLAWSTPNLFELGRVEPWTSPFTIRVQARSDSWTTLDSVEALWQRLVKCEPNVESSMLLCEWHGEQSPKG
jgi:hypothetical protein